ncbi:MAG TPA: dihydrolipoamide acetyltransferase family protein [Thermomicrobiales bacterium]|nr:dihydrolipoamide acetyltransferase family protein [Thermomicrobiales bacterium]
MANEVVMPRLGWTMEVGRVVEWLKQDGETVEAGDFIFAVESDKAITEVEALDSGILRIPPDSPKIGDEVPVGGMLAYILAPGEPLPSAPSTNGHDTVAGEEQTMSAATVELVGTASRRRGDDPAISPRARRSAKRLGIDWTLLTGSGSTGRIVERDILAARHASPRFRASPDVRRLAAEQGIALETLTTDHPHGRITRADLRATAPSPQPAVASDDHATPLTAFRRTIGQRMAESAHTVAPVTLTTEADAADLAAIRTHLKTDLAGTDEPVPSFTDLLARLTALALMHHPAMNASLADTQIVHHPAVHIGIAVDTKRGLLVPVIRDADRKSVQQIAVESAQLIAQTRDGSINADDLRGGTFTITNLGMYDIDAFTPIINLPECAVLGVGRIISRPVVIDEETETIAVRKMMALSLTFDHRLVDGAPAARFLRHLKQMIERPYTWLLR